MTTTCHCGTAHYNTQSVRYRIFPFKTVYNITSVTGSVQYCFTAEKLLYAGWGTLYVLPKSV